MKKIKIGMCLSGLDGGVGNMILNYFEHMPLENYEVDIISQGEARQVYMDSYNNKGFNVYMVPSKSESIIKNFKVLYIIMKERKYDIVHAHMTLTNFFPLFVAKLCGVKVRISHSHIANKHTLKSKILSKLSKTVATEYFACSQKAGEYLFGKADFKLINNAIDLNEYKYNEDIREIERKNLDIKEEEILIGHVGRFSIEKNHKFLIEIFEKLHKKLPNSKLILIGEGSLESSIKQQIKDKHLEENVILTGTIKDVARKLQALDLFILPSLWEGLGLAAIEAQASGIKCILSDKVPKEAKLSENVKFIKLDNEVNEWVNVCIKMINKKKVNNNTQTLKDLGYDIRVEAKKLDKFYTEVLNK